MEKRILKLILLLAPLVLISFSSCSAVASHASVLRGNYAFGRGDYQNATVRYLTAGATPEYQAYIEYNLGNVYYALGELDAAVSQWDKAAQEAPDDILFGVHFNRGVLNYELGQYQAAYEEFRKALTIDGASVDAKVNLELSLQKAAASGNVRSGRVQSASGQEEDPSAQTARVMEYIRRKERQRWFAEEREPDDSAVNDW